MPGLIESKSLKRGSVRFIGRQFSKKGSKALETRVWIYFPTGSTAGNVYPVSRGHDLGITPTHMVPVVVKRDPATGPPGQVYTVGSWATKDRVQLCCTTDNTWAEVILR
jgi:hypothetical protein